MKKTLLGVSVIALSLLPKGADAGFVLSAHSKDLSGVSGLLLSVTDEQTVEGAKNFIDTMGKRATGFLGNQGISQSQKEAEFRKLLRDSFDMKTMGRFAMGNYWKAATDAQQGEYLKLFEDMVVEVYSARFNDYNGQDLDVREARPKGTNDTLVNSYIVDKSGQEFGVDWVVRHKDGRYKIIDVVIEGVSMSITQRSDFSSVIQRGGGDVGVLIAHLRQ